MAAAAGKQGEEQGRGDAGLAVASRSGATTGISAFASSG
jgi:hypothetical protein